MLHAVQKAFSRLAALWNAAVYIYLMVLLFMVRDVNSNEYIGWKWFLLILPGKIHSRMHIKNKQQQQKQAPVKQVEERKKKWEMLIHIEFYFP